MSVAAANRTIEAFLDAMREAQAMANCGQVGDDLNYLLRHAEELLDVMDEELLEIDSAGQRDLLTSAAILHEKFERLRDDYGAEPRTK